MFCCDSISRVMRAMNVSRFQPISLQLSVFALLRCVHSTGGVPLFLGTLWDLLIALHVAGA